VEGALPTLPATAGGKEDNSLQIHIFISKKNRKIRIASQS